MTELRSLEEVVDERVGLVKRVVRLSKSREEPEIPIVCQATLSNFDYRKGDLLERIASGKGHTEAAARLSAVAEGLERYCANQQRENALVYSDVAHLEGPAITPPEFVLYSEDQYAQAGFRYRRWNGDQKIAWVPARKLEDDSLVYAPAALVYMNHTGTDGSEYFTIPTSSGLAAGPDRQSAVLAALYELVERDAFLITWLNRLPSPRVDCAKATGVAGAICRHYARFGIETFVFDVTTDISIPVMMACTLDRSGSGPSVVVGLGCNLHPAIALERALMEVSQVRVGAVPKFRTKGPAEHLRTYTDIHTLEDHSGFAALPANLQEFSFLFEAGRTRDPAKLQNLSTGSVTGDIQRCRTALEAVGSTVAYVDLTQPDLEPFKIKVVRAIAPGTQPIHFGFGEERLGGIRLFSVPRNLGFRDTDTSAADLNPCPHPLA